MNWIKKLIEFVKKLRKPDSKPTPGPYDAVDKAQFVDPKAEPVLEWVCGGFEGAARSVTIDPRVVLTKAWWQGGNLRFDMTETKPFWTSYWADCNAHVAMFRKEADGVYRGGKWDHLRPNPPYMRDTNNIYPEDYNNWGQYVPASGQEIIFLVMSNDFRYRTNMLRLKFK